MLRNTPSYGVPSFNTEITQSVPRDITCKAPICDKVVKQPMPSIKSLSKTLVPHKSTFLLNIYIYTAILLLSCF